MLNEDYELMYNKSLIFSVKLAKSRSSKGWSISRDSIMPLIPKLPYETECDIIVGDINAKARLNLEPRIFYRSTQKELIQFLEDLIDEEDSERIEIEMLLNQEDKNPIIYREKYEELLAIVDSLKKENEMLRSEILNYEKIINSIKNDQENSSHLMND